MKRRVSLQRWALAVFGIGVALGFAGGRAPAQIPQFKLENPQIGYPMEGMGRSIAVDGNTKIVSAPDQEKTQAALPADAPANWWGTVQKDLAAREYHLSWQEKPAIEGLGAAWQAPNRAQDLRTYFTRNGPRVVRRTEERPSWVWGLELDGVGGEKAPAIDKMAADKNRIELRRGDGLVEWYVNNDKGLEQGFTLSAPPAPKNSQSAIRNPKSEIVIDLAVRGDLIPDMMPDGRTIEFLSKDGVGLIHYGKLKAGDATGRNLPARMEILSESATKGAGSAFRAPHSALRILVDATGAQYPVTIDPMATTANWTAEGNQAGANFGLSVSTAGDVNGDGYSDVIVGAPHFDNGQTDEGRAYVYLGSASGLSATAAWTAESNQVNAYFGLSVSTAGDVNGDGYSDVIVAAPHFDNGQTDEGRAFVWYGSADGLGPNGTPLNAAWTAESDQAGASFGLSVSTAGDVNGDGYSDVIVGCPNYDCSSNYPDSGRAYLYYGTSAGLSPTTAWIYEELPYPCPRSFVGHSVCGAGDVNGDGYDDVAVGSPRSSSPSRVYVFYGASTGLSTTGLIISQYEGAGVRAAGDVNGDGYADLCVFGEAGRQSVHPGSASGLSYSPIWVAEDPPGAGGIMSMSGAGDVNGDGYSDVVISFGWINPCVYLGSASGLSPTAAWTLEGSLLNSCDSVATAGDVNGDAYSDIVVGQSGYRNGEIGEGRACVYHGSPWGPHTNANWTGHGNQQGAEYGFSVANAGDVNGDGYSDVIVGAPGYDYGGTDVGRAFAYHGSAAGPATTANWSAWASQAGARFGACVASAGDLNGDGFADVIVGAPFYGNGQTHEGRAYVYHGSASGLPPASNWRAESDLAEAWFGSSVASAGDINGDGFADVLVGAYGYHNGQTDEGRAYLYHGSAAGLPATANWTAEGNQASAKFGTSVASAGDVNADGYADVIVGAPGYDAEDPDEGRAYVYHGSSAGLPASPNWTAEGDLESAQFGASVATAGDVNGDGFSDVIVGSPGYDSGQLDEGWAFVYHGSAAGLAATPSWHGEANEDYAKFGSSVASAGDVNGDGFSDVIVGAPEYDDYTGYYGQEGRAYVYLGSASGLSTAETWRIQGAYDYANLGMSVASAGDVNGDGFSDVIVGSPGFHYYLNEGMAFLYYGNGKAGGGVSLVPCQKMTNGPGLVSPLGFSDSETMVTIGVVGHTPPFGRASAKLEVEVKPLGVLFNGANTVLSANWTALSVPGTPMSLAVAPPIQSATGVYHWRARFRYKPVSTPGLGQTSRWLTPWWNGAQEGDFRLYRAIPVVSLFRINGGAASTGNRTVTLNNACTNSPTQYMASELSSFSGASWQTYSAVPSFTLSAGNGIKTVHFKAKNAAGESPAVSDTITLNEVSLPTVSSFRINGGAASTGNRTVTLNNACTNSPTQYMASELSSFSGASWQTYSAAPSFTLSSGNGTKTVHFKAKNAAGESPAVSDTITLNEVSLPTVSSFRINGGAASTGNRTVTLNNACTNSPTQYMASELSSFSGASWQTYSAAPSFTLSSGNGTKTVHFKAKNANGQSAVVSDAITLNQPAGAGAAWMLYE